MGTEANPHGSDDHEKLPPMRSQTELNLPPVEPWPEPVNGKQLLDELMHWLARLVVLPKWAAQTVALWIVHTSAF